MYRNRIALVLVIVSVVAVAVAIGFSHVFVRSSKFQGNEASLPRLRDEPSFLASSSGGSLVIDLPKERTHWIRRIDDTNSRKSYEEMKMEYDSAPPGTQHLVAHLFGEILYEKLSISGVTLCDGAFAFGCYHGLFGAAIYNQGFDVISTLNRECTEGLKDVALACQHGIGHGILAFIGESALTQALDLCAKLSDRTTLGGCTGGVFMEYNFSTSHTALSPGTITRPLKAGHSLHEPCTGLQDKYQPSCYFEQVQWWYDVFTGDFGKIGLLCSEVIDDGAREACFQGAGTYGTVVSLYDSSATVAVCQQMPYLNASLLCREGAAWHFLGNPKLEASVSELCFDLSGTLKERCLEKLVDREF